MCHPVHLLAPDAQVGLGYPGGPAVERLARDGDPQRFNLPRPMFGAHPTVAAGLAVHFVSPTAIEDDLAARLGLRRRLVPVKNVRGRGKADLPLNDAMPDIKVDPDTFTVRIDGEVWQEQPATELPMAQRYFLF